MLEKTSIIVVDDHALFRTGVVHCLNSQDDFVVLGEGASGADALRIANELDPDIALVDISMPGNGVDAAAAIRDAGCRARVVMLTVSEEDDDIVSALEAGAVGYLLKGIGASDLIDAVRRIALGETFVSPNLAAKVFAGMNTRNRPRDFVPVQPGNQGSATRLARDEQSRGRSPARHPRKNGQIPHVTPVAETQRAQPRRGDQYRKARMGLSAACISRRRQFSSDFGNLDSG